MGERTGIEWTDATWNPVTGCTRVSTGCDHCYAAALAEKRLRRVYLRRLPVRDSVDVFPEDPAMYRPILIALSGALLAGCASIFSSGADPVSFETVPAGAEVFVNGESMGQTPLQLQLQANKQHMVTLRRRGCEDESFALTTHVQGGWVVLDILVGVIGVAVDAGTGAWKAFDDGRHSVQLRCG